MPLPARITPAVRKLRSLWRGSENDTRWIFTSAAGALAASLLTRGLMKSGWRGVRGEDPPNQPSVSPGGWPRALAWGAVTGAIVGVARVLGRRGSAAAWEKVAGVSPPA
jgi:hypothetical protein